jgi:methionyl-tRNA formyltransferase
MADGHRPGVRTVYVGTSAFAAAVLARLHASPYGPSLVVTRPDSPQGRGRKLRPPPTAAVATELGIELYQPESINSDEARARIASHRPDAVCVCAFGALIKEPLLSEHRMLNVHPSLLPRWRGAAPIERAILAGDERTGVSIMVVTAGLDSGPVCLQAGEEIGPEDDYGTLSGRLEQLGGDLLIRVLAENPDCAEQADEGVTYADKLTAEDRRLDPFGASASELALRVRALNPHVGAYLDQPGDGRLGVIKAREALAPGLVPGELLLEPPRPLLGCAAGALELLVVQPPGKRPMPAEDYLRGLRR